jgi:hypothetical protein
MKTSNIVFHAALLGLLLTASAANAQIFRAYLASDGSDANPCTLTAPCRLLPAALTAVANGGEIWMLDSANFNSATVTVGKSVSILAIPGAVGSIVALNGGPAISITAAGLKVALRNVVIGPVITAAAGTHGVSMSAASSLTIEDSLIASLPGTGILVVGGTLKVTNSTVRDMGSNGVSVQGARAVISSTRLFRNFTAGLQVDARNPSETSVATVSDSVISGGSGGGTSGYGVFVIGQISATASARVSVIRSTIEGTNNALFSVALAGATSQISVGGSLIAGNASPWGQDGAGSAILSLGDNQMYGNFTPPQGTKTPLAGQ